MRLQRASGRVRAGALLLGAVLATLVAWSPANVAPVLAAGDLGVRAATTYTVDPDAGRIHVAIEFTVTNNRRNTATVIYYYRDLTFGIHPDVRAVRATDGSGALTTTTKGHDDFTEVEVRLRANLYYGRSTTFTLRYDLVGGAPRSDSPIRVGRAFAAFGVWAFGDNGKGTVEVRLPPGFTSTVQGDELPQVGGGVGTGIVLRARPQDTNEFFAIVSADSVGQYDRSRLSLPGGVEIVVLAWPEDEAWRDSVTRTMETGIPALQELIGLDWPVFRDLNVQERYTPALEGYAGVFFADSQRIDMSEDLDPVTTLHEASHAWFNETLFTERWITEGLAEEYAGRAHAAAEGGSHEPPPEPDPSDPAAVRLNAWVFPTIVRDDTDDREVYGYRAAGWLVHEIVREAGVDGMRAAFRMAYENVTAYPGAGEPERVAIRDSWKRFLDLTQPIDEPDPVAVLVAYRELVVAPTDERALALRAGARDAYRALVDAGDGWLPPWYVRGPMGEWEFEEATTRIAEATTFLVLRDQVEAAAADAGLTLDDRLRLAYEGATDGLGEASALARRQLDALTAIGSAREKVEATPDLVAQIGLLGETPRAPYEAARSAFNAGDVDQALAQAAAATALMDGATPVGEARILVAGIVFAAIVLLLLAVALLRARRRRRALAVAAPVAARPSGTLLADQEAPPPPLDEGPPEPDGGEPR